MVIVCDAALAGEETHVQRGRRCIERFDPRLLGLDGELSRHVRKKRGARGAVHAGLGFADRRMALKDGFDVFAEVHAVTDVARGAVHVTGDVGQRSDHLSGHATDGAIDLPAQIDDTRPRRVQKNTKDFSSILAPPVGELEGAHLRELFVGSLDQGTSQALDEAVLESLVGEPPDAPVQLGHRGLRARPLRQGIVRSLGDQLARDERRGDGTRGEGSFGTIARGQHFFDAVEVTNQRRRESPLHDRPDEPHERTRAGHVRHGLDQGFPLHVAKPRVKTAARHRPLEERALAVNETPFHPLVRRFDPFDVEPELLRDARAHPLGAALAPGVLPGGQATRAVPAIGVGDESPHHEPRGGEATREDRFVEALGHGRPRSYRRFARATTAARTKPGPLTPRSPLDSSFSRVTSAATSFLTSRAFSPTVSSVVENTIFGFAFQMRAKSNPTGDVDGSWSAVCHPIIVSYMRRP